MPTVPGVWSGGRSFDFGAVSSHGVSAVEVYKSANAILPTGGIGSTINMVTTKPLDADSGAAFSVRALTEKAAPLSASSGLVVTIFIVEPIPPVGKIAFADLYTSTAETP